MNMQSIQILFLLFDTIIRLAPWQMVTEMMERFGYGAGKSVARSPFMNLDRMIGRDFEAGIANLKRFTET
jgi:hypothetical protein